LNAPTELALSAQETDLAPAADSFSLLMSSDSIDRIYRVADTMSSGVIAVPEHFRKKPADCFAVCLQAFGWGMNPYAVAQKTHITQGGALGYEAQLIYSVVVNRAPIKARPEFEFIGDWSKILGKVKEMKSERGGKYYVSDWKPADEEGLGVIIRCTLRGESEPREVVVMMSQAWPRFSTQWATDPQQQICYLATRKWARRYTPDVILGVYTKDELDEAPPPPRNMGPAEVVEPKKPAAPGLTDEQLATWRREADKGMAAAQAHWKAMGPELRKLATEDQKADMLRVATDADKARTVDNKPPAAAAPAEAGGDDFAREMEAEEQRMRDAQAHAAGGAE
jgi:hypothetical protein